MEPASLRADAAGNRARIIAAARAAVAGGGEVKLNAIARQAGVGQGTLYRHFPTRDDLLAEVYREDVGELVAAAPALLAQHEPLTALELWLDRVADYAEVKRGVFAAVEAAVSRGLAARSHGPIGEAVTALLDAGKADGSIRPDIDARDVILLIGYLTRLEQSEWEARARHLLRVVLDGLRRVPGRLPIRQQVTPAERAGRRLKRQTARQSGERCSLRGTRRASGRS
jgi:AcrR family transcriptional regulator